jgi:2-phospho-L-lactate transferase/gluconeogenesis factor (CofD/UPF0052 family)
MKIVIVAGGTGSIALQKGLFEEFESHVDGVDLKVLVNAYDNGLSTGAVRRVLGGSILGPSDVRKNQTTRLSLLNSTSPWSSFLDIRFTCATDEVREYCEKSVEQLVNLLPQENRRLVSDTLSTALNAYFSAPTALKIDYSDFALANIIYAGLSRANGNSLRKAANIIAHLMGIPDCVILNDDTSLFLGAVSAKGHRLTDEGDIVNWGKTDDPLVQLQFTDEHGKASWPKLSNEAQQALLQADLIILSSGTQWSSLFPTYASLGFKETIEQCRAKIVMVMNRQPDRDSPGQTASDIIRIMTDRWFPRNRLRVVIDTAGHSQMAVLDKDARERVHSIVSARMGDLNSRTHDKSLLVMAIQRSYFGDSLDSQHIMLDYDDTLVGRGNRFPKASSANKNLIRHLTHKVSICTGNSIKNIALNVPGLTIFADGGVNEYHLDYTADTQDPLPVGDDATLFALVRCIAPEALLSNQVDIDSLLQLLAQHGISMSKLENRGNAMVSIRPVDREYRDAVFHLARLLVDESLHVEMTGRTTVEISNGKVSKRWAVLHQAKQYQSITYVGDEIESGNDAFISQMASEHLKVVPVSTPTETAFFLMAVISTSNLQHAN